jgi:hypothetical protein
MRKNACVHAAGTGHYWPLLIAGVLLRLALTFGLNALGITSFLSGRLSGWKRGRWTGIDPFGFWQMRFVLGVGLLIIAVGVAAVT